MFFFFFLRNVFSYTMLSWVFLFLEQSLFHWEFIPGTPKTPPSLLLQAVCEEALKIGPQSGLFLDAVVFGGEDFRASIGTRDSSSFPFCPCQLARLAFALATDGHFHDNIHYPSPIRPLLGQLSPFLGFDLVLEKRGKSKPPATLKAPGPSV